MTDFYGYRSYTSLEELGSQVINYGMSMLTHHRSYMYSVQDILNPEKDIKLMIELEIDQRQRAQKTCAEWQGSIKL